MSMLNSNVWLVYVCADLISILNKILVVKKIMLYSNYVLLFFNSNDLKYKKSTNTYSNTEPELQMVFNLKWFNSWLMHFEDILCM